MKEIGQFLEFFRPDGSWTMGTIEKIEPNKGYLMGYSLRYEPVYFMKEIQTDTIYHITEKDFVWDE